MVAQEEQGKRLTANKRHSPILTIDKQFTSACIMKGLRPFLSPQKFSPADKSLPAASPLYPRPNTLLSRASAQAPTF